MVVAGMDGDDNSGECADDDVTTLSRLTRWCNGVLQCNDAETVRDGVSDGAEGETGLVLAVISEVLVTVMLEI